MMSRTSLTAFARTTLVSALVCLTACLPKARLNTDCEWAGEPTTRLYVRDAAHLAHLTEDALIAEELAIRYSDSFGPRGGCLHCVAGVRATRAAIIEIRRTCEARLTGVIADTHGVTRDQVRQALERRDPRVDVAAVLVPMALLFAVIASVVAGRVYRHVVDDQSAVTIFVAVIAMFLASVVLSAIAMPLGEIWAGLVEGVRLRSQGHLSNRAFRLPGIHHRAAIFIGGIVLFWIVA
jgi:hypothetical protein